MGIGGMLEEFVELHIQAFMDMNSLYSGINSFLTPAVLVLCSIGGLKIGRSFLSRAFR